MKTYGLIGKSLVHSFSKNHFTEKFKEEGTDAIYENFELPDISEFNALVLSKEIAGLNVTIPYKESIIPFLDGLDDVAKKIGAVNTIKFTENGQKIGYNTDAYGFHQSIKPFLASHHERALILGTGGASKAIVYVLQSLGLKVLFVSRTPKTSNEISYKDINENVITSHKLIVNTTPLGMFPNVSTSPGLAYEHFTSEHLAYDLVYNPEETLFMKKAKAQGATSLSGLQMLYHQAEKAWEVWNN